jgi:hypothetical protein
MTTPIEAIMILFPDIPNPDRTGDQQLINSSPEDFIRFEELFDLPNDEKEELRKQLIQLCAYFHDRHLVAHYSSEVGTMIIGPKITSDLLNSISLRARDKVIALILTKISFVYAYEIEYLKCQCTGIERSEQLMEAINRFLQERENMRLINNQKPLWQHISDALGFIFDEIGPYTGVGVSPNTYWKKVTVPIAKI